MTDETNDKPTRPDVEPALEWARWILDPDNCENPTNFDARAAARYIVHLERRAASTEATGDDQEAARKWIAARTPGVERHAGGFKYWLGARKFDDLSEFAVGCFVAGRAASDPGETVEQARERRHAAAWTEVDDDVHNNPETYVAWFVSGAKYEARHKPAPEVDPVDMRHLRRFLEPIASDITWDEGEPQQNGPEYHPGCSPCWTCQRCGAGVDSDDDETCPPFDHYADCEADLATRLLSDLERHKPAPTGLSAEQVAALGPKALAYDNSSEAMAVPAPTTEFDPAAMADIDAAPLTTGEHLGTFTAHSGPAPTPHPRSPAAQKHPPTTSMSRGQLIVAVEYYRSRARPFPRAVWCEFHDERDAVGPLWVGDDGSGAVNFDSLADACRFAFGEPAPTPGAEPTEGDEAVARERFPDADPGNVAFAAVQSARRSDFAAGRASVRSPEPAPNGESPK